MNDDNKLQESQFHFKELEVTHSQRLVKALLLRWPGPLPVPTDSKNTSEVPLSSPLRGAEAPIRVMTARRRAQETPKRSQALAASDHPRDSP